MADAAMAPTSPFIDGGASPFRTDFDQRCFAFRHRLADHPLFALPRLMELVRGLAAIPGELYFDVGQVRVDQRWDQVPLASMRVEEALERIEKAGAWIIIRHSERDPAYNELLDQCMAEFEELVGRRFREEMRVQHAIIFITSPGRVTPYHIDRECNFILQVKGEKQISVFDQTDRQVLPDEELERFWTFDNNAARYKAEYQNRAHTFRLGPGDGVHVPVNAPHWVQNGSGISVTLSLNFWYRDASRSDVYRANYYLRRLGVRPAPPGDSMVDVVKRRGIRWLDEGRWLEKARALRDRLGHGT